MSKMITTKPVSLQAQKETRFSETISDALYRVRQNGKDEKTPKAFGEEALAEGFRQGDSEVLKFIYKKHYPSVARFVCKNAGTDEEAKDIFQEALLVCYQKVSAPDFSLSCKLGSFIYAVASRMWRKKLRDERPLALQTTSTIEDIEDEGIDELIRRMKRFKLYEDKFAQLSKGCQELLKMFLQGHSTATVKAHFGFGSISYTKKRKCQCKAKLIKLVMDDPDYQGLS